MNKRNVTSNSLQLVMFDPLAILPHDTHPPELPFTVGLVRVTQNDNQRLHCAIDIVASAKDENYDTAKKSYENFKAKIQDDSTTLNFSAVEIKARAADGRMRKTDFLTDKQMLRLLTEIPGKLAAKYKDWLSEVGAERLEETENPELGEQRARDRSIASYARMGKSDKWIGKRTKSIDRRNDLTDYAKDTHIYHTPDYAAITIVTYEVLFNAAKAEIVAMLGLTETQAKHFRDYLSELATDAVSAAEGAATAKMQQYGTASLSTAQQLDIVRECARLVAPGFVGLAQYLGVDLATGKRLLKDDNVS